MAKFASRLSGWLVPGGGDRNDRRELRTGATFARITKTQVMETARVLSIVEDKGGIAHVRYDSRLHRADRTLDHGERTLALPSFLQRFEMVAQRGGSGSASFDRGSLRLP
jgi:hypothetical protein